MTGFLEFQNVGRGRGGPRSLRLRRLLVPVDIAPTWTGNSRAHLPHVVSAGCLNDGALTCYSGQVDPWLVLCQCTPYPPGRLGLFLQQCGGAALQGASASIPSQRVNDVVCQCRHPRRIERERQRVWHQTAVACGERAFQLKVWAPPSGSPPTCPNKILPPATRQKSASQRQATAAAEEE
jgi:hypothetical protein